MCDLFFFASFDLCNIITLFIRQAFAHVKVTRQLLRKVSRLARTTDRHIKELLFSLYLCFQVKEFCLSETSKDFKY